MIQQSGIILNLLSFTPTFIKPSEYPHLIVDYLPLTYPHKNPQPLSRDGVFWGSEKPALYPYLCIIKGLQTLAHHYESSIATFTSYNRLKTIG